MRMPQHRSTLRAAGLAALLALVAALPAPVRVQLTAQTGNNSLVDPKTYQDLRWRSVGPHRGGRVTAIAGVRTQPNVFYMGATGGGVWKTENYGITWYPVSDGQITTGSIGAIGVSDSNPNIVYVGTGSSAIRSNVILGRGIWKSTDAGKTWQSSGLADAGQIGTVRVHPTNPDIAYAAVLGNPFAFGPTRGVYRTKDGGKTWDQVLKINDETGVVSLAMNTSDPNELYAGAWRAQRKGWTIISGGPAQSGGVYKSVNGGETWTHVTRGLPANLIGKVWVDIAQSNPKTVYAMVEAPGAEGGLYRSTDAGLTWTLQDNSQLLRARPFYFNYVQVNPKNENEVWVSELGVHKSIDGGKTWTTVNPPHGDNHGVWFNPDNPQIMIQSNDGGATITQDGGKSWSSVMNQPTAELYMLDTDDQSPYKIVAPQQDNSTVAVYSVPPFSWPIDDPTQTWFQASGCESGQIRIVPSGKIIYGDCKGEFGRYNVETGQEQHYWIYPQQRYGLNPKDQKYRFVRQAPIEIDPHNPNVVYHGSQYLHRTTDGGIHWQTISPDLTAHTPETQTDSGEPITRDMTGEEVYSALYSIRAARTEPGVIWTGSNDGPVWVTRDAGRSWKNVTPKGLPPGGRVHTIEDSPHRRGSAYVSVYRIYFGDFKPYLYATNDYGQTWTLLTDGSNGIPADHPMHVVREDPEQEGLLYAGTWYGVFVSFDRGKHWQPLQQNLPATPVTDIKVKNDDLVISTMGRSFWIMDDVSPLRQIAASVKGARETSTAPGSRGSGPAQSVTRDPSRPAIGTSGQQAEAQEKPAARGGAAQTPAPRKAAVPFDPAARVFLFSPATGYRWRYSPGPPSPDRPEYPAIGARIDYYLASAPTSDLKLEILDANGVVVRTFSSAATSAAPAGRGGGRRGGGGMSALPKKVGMNRFVWDYRYPGPWSASNPNGEGAGPIAAPGTYRVRLTADGVTKTEPLVVRADPRVLKDNVTQADLVEQTRFQLKVRDLLSDARKLTDRVKKAMDAGRGDKAALEALYYKFENRPGPYTENMMLAQIQNIARETGQADQKVGTSAYERYGDLVKELNALRAEVDRAAGR
jgi:photosystem II stability/assembly factor-like uncharacterized protein